MAQTAAKVCVLCNIDCSDRPRVKDEAGRYMCRACADRQTGVAPKNPVVVKAVPVPPPPALDDEGFDLRSAAAMEARTQAMDLPEQQSCPKCHGFMQADQRVCMRCGFDRKRGAKVITRVEKVKEPKVRKGRGSSLGAIDIIGCGAGIFALLLGGAAFLSPEVAGLAFLGTLGIAIASGLTVRILQGVDGEWTWFILGWFIGITDLIWVAMNWRMWIKVAYFGSLVGLLLSAFAMAMHGEPAA